jgi:hypothetical protein
MTNRPASPHRKIKPTLIVCLGAIVLALMIIAGFQRGWLALQSDQRPLGKLRPGDLVARTASVSDTTLAQGPSDTIDSLPDATSVPLTSVPPTSDANSHVDSKPPKPGTDPITPTRVTPRQHEDDKDEDD